MSAVIARNLIVQLRQVNENEDYKAYYVTEFKDLSKAAMAKHMNQGKLYAGQVSNLVKDLRRSASLLTEDEMNELNELESEAKIEVIVTEADVLAELLQEHLDLVEAHYKRAFGREIGGLAGDDEDTRAAGLKAFHNSFASDKTSRQETIQDDGGLVEPATGVKSEEGNSIDLRCHWLQRLDRTGARLDRLAQNSVGSVGFEVDVTELKPIPDVVSLTSTDVQQLVGALAQSIAAINQMTQSQLNHQSLAGHRGGSAFRNELNMGEGISPKGLVLQPFSGENPEEFEGWWQMFEVVVGRNFNLSPMAKLLYLKSYMIKGAKDVIDALPVTEECYEIACNTLRDRFGFDSICYDLPSRKLKELSLTRPPNNPQAWLRLYYQQLAQYQRIIVKGAFPMLYMDLCLDPYPGFIQLRVRQERVKFTQQFNQQIGHARFMKELKCAIQVEAEGWVEETHEVQHMHEVEHSKPNRHWTTTCKLCRGNHVEHQCSVYSTAQKRRKIVEDNRWCPICYKAHHGPGGCKGATCWKCRGEDHGVAICPDWVDFSGEQLLHQRK